MTRIAVLASGTGTNLQALIDQQAQGALPEATLALVISDQATAPALERARAAGIASQVCAGSERTVREAAMQTALEAAAIDLICLAGYMRVLSADFVAAWPGRILNIHPSLLPALPGLHTHRRALAEGHTEHGATVHFVDASLDGGPRILCARTPIRADDTEDALAARVLRLEHRLYATAVAAFCAGDLTCTGNEAIWRGTPLATPLNLDALV